LRDAADSVCIHGRQQSGRYEQEGVREAAAAQVGDIAPHLTKPHGASGGEIAEKTLKASRRMPMEECGHGCSDLPESPRAVV